MQAKWIKIIFVIIQDYQVKEQCQNCTFLNGQFAEECEMCGEPLTARGTLASTRRKDDYY